MEVGYVLSSRDALVYLDGLPGVRIFDLVENEGGIRGVVTALHPDKVETWILDEGQVFPGELFRRKADQLTVALSNSLLGRSVNPLGLPIDGKGLIPKATSKQFPIDQNAPGLPEREFIKEQLHTGIALIDTILPLGKGQRQLFMGDAHSGKTSILIDMVINQASLGTICIYASIGKPISEVRRLIDSLSASQALKNTVVVAASSTEPAPLIFLAPSTALTLAEFFQKQGQDVLVILDDLGVHAKFYRELALLGERMPGRESYPGDIFYTHAHILERAGKFNQSAGGGSITAIPVIELNLNDFTTFMPTNLMSMTDGHMLFKASLRSQGQRPAIDVSLSVSRVGGQTQGRLQSLLSQKIREVFARAQELSTVSRFSGELPPETQLVLKQRDLILEILNQEPLSNYPIGLQLCLLGLTFTSLARDQDKGFFLKNKKNLINFFNKTGRPANFQQTVLKLQRLEDLVAALEKLVPELQKLYP